MFFDTAKNDHGLPFNPIKAIIAPRPIGWISAVSSSGQLNLAPYSFFNMIATHPPLVMFASEGWKDSVAFISETQEFVCNLATFALRQEMNATSAALPRGESEFTHAGLDMEPSRMVRPPRVKQAPAALECKLVELRQLTRADGTKIDTWMAIGQIVGVYINDDYIKDGRFDMLKARPLARCGYTDFASVDTAFAIERPKGGGNPSG